MLASIAHRHNKSIAQVVLRWLVQRGVVVIPKSVRKERIVENIDIFDFELHADDMKQISTLDTRESLFLSYLDPEVAERMGSWIIDL
ncbi:Glyoxal reductase [compost metagenome]